jgi:hypothetical protein
MSEGFVKLGLVALLLAFLWAGGMIIRAVFQQPPTSVYGTTPNQHPEYRDADGDGFVPAQGDPLYDSWYAQQVNPGNTGSQLTLAQATETVSRAGLNESKANLNNAGARAIMVILGFCAAVVVIAGISKLLGG